MLFVCTLALILLVCVSVPGLSEGELLERARSERAAIVGKYERGRTEGDEDIALPWEDPQYEEYHVTDKWGFIQ